MRSATSFPADTPLDRKRVDLIALSNQLRDAHLEIRETSNLLKQESEELSKESRVLHNNGYNLKSLLDAGIALIEIENLIEPTAS